MIAVGTLYVWLAISLWQAAVTGVAGFGAALGVHAAVGYHDLIHVGPAVAGAIAYGGGLALKNPGRALGVSRAA